MPLEMELTTLRPDLVLVSRAARRVITMELTVPWEARIDEAWERKMRKYAELVEDCTGNGWNSELWTVEFRCRDFAGFR